MASVRLQASRRQRRLQLHSVRRPRAASHLAEERQTAGAQWQRQAHQRQHVRRRHVLDQWLRSNSNGDYKRISVSPCRTLAITRITAQDEAIYQCIAENSAGTNQASARLALSQGPDLPQAPSGLRAAPLSSSSLQLTWEQPSEDVSQEIIGYVVHIRRLGGEFDLEQTISSCWREKDFIHQMQCKCKT